MTQWINDTCDEALDALREVGLTGLADDMERILQHDSLQSVAIFRHPGLEELADGVRTAEDTLDILDSLKKLAETLGVCHATVHVVEQSERSAFDPQVITTYSQEWVDRYVGRNYAAQDPVLAVASVRNDGFFWDEIDYDNVSESFLRDAQDAGIGRNGYTYPLTLWTGARVALTISTTTDAAALRKAIQPLEADLGLLAQDFCEAFAQIACWEFVRSDKPAVALLNLIRAMANGATFDEAAQAANVPCIKTAADQICIFYEARTLIQAVMRCVSLGHLRGVPFTSLDITSSNRVALPPTARSQTS